MHMAALLLTLGGLLSGLLAVAVVQRRGTEAATESTGVYVTDSQPRFNVPSSPRTPVPMSIGRIAAGVWLGLWMFVFTAAVPAAIIVKHWGDRTR